MGGHRRRIERLRRSNLLVFGQNEGLGYGPVQGLAEVAPGVIWAGKPSDGLYRWEGRTFSRLAAAGLSRRYPESISLLMARDGNCWISGAPGLWCSRSHEYGGGGGDRRAGGAERHRTGRRPGGWRVGRHARGPSLAWSAGEWVAQTNYSQTRAITAIVQDAEGAMWIGTEGGGLSRFKDGASAHFEKGAGLLSDWIRTLHLGAQGTLWIGTAGGGLSRWRNGQLATFTTREGLPDNTISQILEDDAGRLWLGSNRGIACVSKGELEELAAGKIAVVYPQVYGRAEGMPSEECTGGFYPAGLKTRSGRLCFSTLKGIRGGRPATASRRCARTHSGVGGNAG